MRKITCIALDDEPLALGLIVSYIKKTPFLKLCGEFDNPLDAMEFLEEHQVQLLFLDIQMPDLTGINFAHVLDKKYKIIFTTAYAKYALEGFQVEALDYLLKPISYEMFLKTADRAKKYFDLIDKVEIAQNDLHIKADKEYLFVKADHQLKKVNYKDIIYFEGLKDYIKLYLKSSGKPVIFHATLKSIEEKLPSDIFMRTHRSYIVNLENIQTIEKYMIFYGNKYVPVSDKYKKKFDEFVRIRFL